MKIKTILTYSAVIFILLSGLESDSFSQKSNVKSPNSSCKIKNQHSNKLDLPSAEINSSFNTEELSIILQMDRIKNTRSGNSGEILENLQKKLESVNHRTTSKTESPSGFIEKPESKNYSEDKDDIPFQKIYSGTLVKGIAVQVQQNYTGAGTIWVAVGAGLPDTGSASASDTLIVYRSTDNTGNSFSEFTRVILGAANKFYPEDAIDMEIIELNNLTKYIYIVYGYTTNGYQGLKKAGCTVIRDNPYLVNNFNLNFPGSSNNMNNYFRPRITSDIGTYPVSPYVTIVLTQDSVIGTDNWYLTKYCRIYNPFTTIPLITYVPKSIYTPSSPVEEDYTNTVQTDIAYVNSGSGVTSKMIFVVSGYPGSEDYFFIYKTDASSSGYPYFSESLYNANEHNEYFRIASAGGPGQTLLYGIFSGYYNNSGNWDEYLLYADITDGNDTWTRKTVNNDSRNSRYGDITGTRRVNGKFYYAYRNEVGCSFSNYASGYIDHFNNTESVSNSLNKFYMSSHASPKPAFRFVNNDSCMTVIPYTYEVFSVSGCNAPLTLDLKLNLQGMYNISTDLNNWDEELSVYLAEGNSPYNISDSSVNFLCSNNNNGFYTFENASEGNYYIVIKHRNSVETWSAVPYSFNGLTPVYFDMRNSSGSAYGDNLIQVNSFPDRFAIFSGDVNRDGIVDGSDLSEVENDVSISLTGHVQTDLTGDELVDAGDLSIVENNATQSVSAVTP